MLPGRAIRDGAWRLFDWDPATGKTVWMLAEDGKVVFETRMPVDAIIRANADAANATSGQRFGEFRRIASIPANLMFSSGMAEAGRQGDQQFMSRWLNDGDNAAWRTFGGRV